MQRYAKALRGEIPIMWAPCWSTGVGCDRTKWVTALPDRYFNMDWFQNTYFIDAFTVDVAKMAHNLRTIGIKGQQDNIIETPLASANPGSYPKILVYIACHPKFGTEVFYLKHGAKGGGKKKDKFAYGGMYHGCKFWSCDLTQAEVAALRKFQYGNTPAAVALFKKRASAERWQAYQSGDYDYKHHQVSFFMICAAAARQCASVSIAATLMLCICLMPQCFAAFALSLSRLAAGTLSW